MSNDEQFVQYARMDRRVDINITPAMLRALNRVANGRKLSRADVIRQSMLTGMPIAFPEYEEFYQQEVKND